MKYLEKGDIIAIISTAGKIDIEKIENSVRIFESWGLKVKIGNTIGRSHNIFAGSDCERLLDFQTMLDDDNVKAIIFARGGYGTIRIIDKVNFFNFIKKPKLIAGYSDITLLHSHINNNLKIRTIHSPMSIDFAAKITSNTLKSAEYLRKALFGELKEYQIKPHQYSKTGITRGTMIGGNLSILYSLIGTKYDFNPTNKILFIEDVGEYLYHLDRIMWSFEKAGKLEKLNGLIVGTFSNMKDGNDKFGENAEQIIHQHVKNYNYPVLFGFEAGHQSLNLSMFFGVDIELNNKNVRFTGK